MTAHRGTDVSLDKQIKMYQKNKLLRYFPLSHKTLTHIQTDYSTALSTVTFSSFHSGDETLDFSNGIRTIDNSNTITNMKRMLTQHFFITVHQ